MIPVVGKKYLLKSWEEVFVPQDWKTLGVPAQFFGIVVTCSELMKSARAFRAENGWWYHVDVIKERSYHIDTIKKRGAPTYIEIEEEI